MITLAQINAVQHIVLQHTPANTQILAVVLVGSHAHGTHIPPQDGGVDDIDFQVIVLPPPESLLGVSKPWEGVAIQDSAPYDITVYSLHKMMSLLSQQNPNVLISLWVEPEDILWLTPLWQDVLVRRDWFGSRQAVRSFVGYAQAQIQAMTRFDGESRTVMRLSHEELSRRGVDVGQMGTGPTMNYREMYGDRNWADADTYRHLSSDVLQAIYRYLRVKFTSGYMGDKRRLLVERSGYDTKNAAHAVRLMRTLVEYLRTGILRVRRTGTDAQEILAIKRGEWSITEVEQEVLDLRAMADLELLNSPLPDRVDTERISNLCAYLHLIGWQRQGPVVLNDPSSPAWTDEYEAR